MNNCVVVHVILRDIDFKHDGLHSVCMCVHVVKKMSLRKYRVHKKKLNPLKFKVSASY